MEFMGWPTSCVLGVQVFLDRGQVGVEVVELDGEVRVDEIQIDVPVQMNDPVPEPQPSGAWIRPRQAE